MKNYKKDPELENDLKTIEMENYISYYETGQFDFKECEYCTGPLLGHIQAKCPRLEYDEKTVNRFKNHLRNLGEFEACFRKGYMKYKQDIYAWTKKQEETTRNN